MNKNLSLALGRAVKTRTQSTVKDVDIKRPDLFSLNSNTELFQNNKGITIKIDRSKDDNLTDFGKICLMLS